MESGSPAKAHDGAPSPATGEDLAHYCRVDWARPELPLRFVSMVARPYGIFLHWRGRANVLCPTSTVADATCELCHNPNVKKAWYAAILGHCVRTSDVVIALVPDHSFHRAARRLESVDLSGRLITLTRPHNYATVSIELSRGTHTLSVAPLSSQQFADIIERTYARMVRKPSPGETNEQSETV